MLKLCNSWLTISSDAIRLQKFALQRLSASTKNCVPSTLPLGDQLDMKLAVCFGYAGLIFSGIRCLELDVTVSQFFCAGKDLQVSPLAAGLFE